MTTPRYRFCDVCDQPFIAAMPEQRWCGINCGIKGRRQEAREADKPTPSRFNAGRPKGRIRLVKDES